MKRLLSFTLLAASVCSAMSCAAPQKTPANTAPAAPITRISVSRTTNGWGGGEALDVTLRSNGTATWDKYKTTSKGPVIAETFNGKIPKARFDKIVVLLRDADFFALKSHYDGGRTDQARTTISAASGGKLWNVSSDGDGAPPAFFKIVQAMRAERDAIRWTKAKIKAKGKAKTASAKMASVTTAKLAMAAPAKPPGVEGVKLDVVAAALCEVHHVALGSDTVPISYGMPMPSELERLQASFTQFPNAKTQVLGGCVIEDNSPQTATVSFCPQCREEQAKWLEAHKTK